LMRTSVSREILSPAWFVGRTVPDECRRRSNHPQENGTRVAAEVGVTGRRLCRLRQGSGVHVVIGAKNCGKNCGTYPPFFGLTRRLRPPLGTTVHTPVRIIQAGCGSVQGYLHHDSTCPSRCGRVRAGLFVETRASLLEVISDGQER
jgi:hypothetical protein